MLGCVHRLEPSAKEQTGPAFTSRGPHQGWLQGPVTRAGAQELPGKDPALGIRYSLVAVLRLSIILSLNLYFVSEV